jgi:hypothetical protein
MLTLSEMAVLPSGMQLDRCIAAVRASYDAGMMIFAAAIEDACGRYSTETAAMALTGYRNGMEGVADALLQPLVQLLAPAVLSYAEAGNSSSSIGLSGPVDDDLECVQHEFANLLVAVLVAGGFHGAVLAGFTNILNMRPA